MPTSKGSNVRKGVARRQKGFWVEDGRGELPRRATNYLLPDDVLLEIFNFYVDGARRVDGWRTLVQVCRRWRHIIFASPRRLNLQLLCTNTRRVKKLLDIWPELPIVIEGGDPKSRYWGISNIDAALKHNDRVCKIAIDPIPSPLLKRFVRMKKPFTALAYLHLWSNDNMAPVIPNSFLGGSAPRLRTISMEGIPFPGLPKLLLSARDLVDLRLWNIPHSGYISPEAMVTALSSLTSLRFLRLEFESPRSRPHQITQRPPLFTRNVLPALTYFSFKGVHEYLEALVSRIDVPQLNDIRITFFNQLIFDIPIFRGFTRRIEAFKVLHRAVIHFFHGRVDVTLWPEWPAHNCMLELGILCEPSDWQLSSSAQVCNSSLPPLPSLERLDVLGRGTKWQDDIEDTQWLEVLHPFIAVKSLYLDKNLAPRFAPALQELTGERATEVLPALQNIYVEGFQSSRPVQEAIAQFVAVRQLLGHPVAGHNWNGRWWE